MTRAGFVLSAVMALGLCGCGAPDEAPATDESAVLPSGQIKWHPGHYVASNAAHKTDTKPDVFKWELLATCQEPNVRGWRGIYDWAALEPHEAGKYDFSSIDADLQTLKGCAGGPKRIGVLVSPADYAHTAPSASVLPQYLLSDPIYGKGADGINHGYWNTSSDFAAALWRKPVNDRFIELLKALGARYNNEPLFEVVMLPETATSVLPAPDFSDSALLAEQERLLAAAVAAFPNTNVSIQNNYMGTLEDTGALLDFTATHRGAQNGPDIFGASAVVKNGSKQYTWGQQCLLGLVPNVRGCTKSLLGQIPIIHDIQEPEMDGTQFRGAGSPFAPLDLYTAADTNLHVNHIFWTYLGPGPGDWRTVRPVIDAHPVTHTACPASYVNSCFTK